jgi:TonB family protein
LSAFSRTSRSTRLRPKLSSPALDCDVSVDLTLLLRSGDRVVDNEGMRLVSLLASLTAIFASLPLACAQEPQTIEPYRIGRGVSAPKILTRVEPEFTAEARQAGYQGIVLMELVVTAEGLPGQVKILSPLGFGLDEAAVNAVNKWRFKPGEKDGKPVPTQATIEVSFRLSDAFDEREEGRRTQYNVAVQKLSKPGKDSERSVETMAKLAKDKYPPAMLTFAELLRAGKATSVTLTPEALVDAAAKKKFAPALYWKALEAIQFSAGSDPAEGVRQMKDAAFRGSPQAQIYMARLHESGKLGVKQDAGEVRRYVRLCATRESECQWILSQMLAKDAKRESSGHLEGLAWALLAANSIPAARQWVDGELALIAPTNRSYVEGLSKQLRR